MNYLIQTSNIVFILSFSLILISCDSKSDSPTVPTDTTKISIVTKIEIDSSSVRYDSLGAIGGQAFYYKFVSWPGSFKSFLSDSVLKMLLNSNFVVVEFWYPMTPSICSDPYPHGREIVKLNQPDTTIYRFGYLPLNSGYSDFCIRYWRNYKIRRVSGA